jgi:WD40 repeat protein
MSSSFADLYARLAFLDLARSLGDLPRGAVFEELSETSAALRPLLLPRAHLIARGGASTLLAYALGDAALSADARALLKSQEAPAPWLVPVTEPEPAAPHRTLEGHQGEIVGLSISPTGTLFSASQDGTIHAWSNEGEPLHQWSAHLGGVNALAAIPGGLLSCGQDGRARCFGEDGRERWTFLPAQRGTLVDVCGDAERAVLLQANQQVSLFSLVDGALLRRFDLPAPALRVIAAPDGARAWALGADFWFELDLRSGTILSLPAGRSSLRPLRLALLDAAGLVAGNEEGVSSWDTPGRQHRALSGLGSGARALARIPGESWLVGYRDRRARLFGPELSLRAVLDAHSFPISAVALSPDGGFALTGSEDGQIKRWPLPAPRATAFPRSHAHQDRINSLFFLDATRAVSGSWDSSLRLWDTDSGKCLQTLQGFYAEITAAIALPGQRVACAGPDRNVRLWDLRDGLRPTLLSAHRDRVTALASLPDGGFLSGGEDKQLLRWDATGRVLSAFSAHKGGVRALALSADRRSFFSVGQPCELKHWTLDGRLLYEYPGDREFVTALAVHPDGRRVLLATQGRALRVLDLSRQQEEARLPSEAWYAVSLALSPEGRWLAAACSDRALRVFDLDSYRECASLALDGPPSACTFSPDGRLLLVGDVAGRLLRLSFSPLSGGSF